MEIYIPKGKYRDKSGERIHWNKPYFDLALRKTFKCEKDKRDYMNKHNIISAGQMDSDNKKIYETMREA